MSTQTSYISAGPYHDIISGTQLILSFSDGVVRVTGFEGAGKTSLLDALLDALQDDDQLALLFKLPLKSPQELHNHLTRELSLPANMGFRKALARFITARPRDKQHLVLLFDDADRMNEETLLELFQLREDVTNNGQGLVSLVLFGLPALNDLLVAPSLVELTRNIALSYQLDPLDRKELEQFCSAAISARNLKIPQPSARTLDYLLSETGGLPGAVLQLLPDMVAEPEIAPRDNAVPLAVAAATPDDESESAAADDAKVTRLRLPFDANKVRMGLYGGVAIAATVAAAWLLYPQLSTLLEQPEPQTVAGVPAAVVEPAPTAAPEPAPATAAATTAPAAEPAVVAEPLVAEAPAVDAAPAATEPAAAPVVVQAPAAEPAPAPAIATLTPPEPATVTPPPASSTVSVVPVLPSATLQDLTQEALEDVVRNWLAAWQNQDLDGYFGAYHTDFAPLYQGTRAAWRDNRSSSITRPAAISIALEDFTVNGESVVGTHVSFWLEYHTASYADRTLKELVISHDLDGSLRILQEINRQVTTLTPTEFLSGPDTSTIAAAPTATAPQQAAPAQPTAAPQPAPAASTTRPVASTASGTHTLVGPPIVHSASITIDSSAVAAPASVSAELTADLRDFLGSWLNAWKQQDVAAYLRHYHPDFHAGAFASRAAWEADRTRKITRPLAIQIHLQNLQVLAATQTLGEVELLMEYHSSYYADRTRKALRLERSAGGDWQITGERNLQVEALPLARLIPGSTLTLRGGSNTIFERAL
jgi:type II secretory pathway predicted ATPase ExeA/ketosteroid isomerase-like protein